MKTVLQVTKFGGLDERKTFDKDLAYATEMMNYRVTENHTLKKRDGQTVYHNAPAVVTGMWSGYLGTKPHFLYTAGDKLYRINDDGVGAEPIGTVGWGDCVLFEFRQRVYIKNERMFTYFDGEALHEVTGYVPLVAIDCTPDGQGQPFEDINMLSPRRRVQFIGDGKTRTFRLPEKNIKDIKNFTENGKVSPLFIQALDRAAGTVTFDAEPAKGNVLEIVYEMPSDRRDAVLKCTGVMLFGGDTDGHVFLWGNPDAPNVRYHSELADGQPSAEYFPENNYTIIGDSEITDIVSQYDRQLIFTKDRAFYSYCELQTDVLGNVFASFPVYNLNGEKGSLLKNAGCIVNNEPITLCADGLNRWSSTTVENEKNAVCFSGAVGSTMRQLIGKGLFEQMHLFNRRSTGELFLFHGGTGVLVYQYRIGAWYAYTNVRANHPVEHQGKLYFAADMRIICFDPDAFGDVGVDFDAYWESPYLSMEGDAGGSGRVKLSRVDWTLYGEGDVELTFAFGGKQLPAGMKRPANHVRMACGTGRVCSGSFRPGSGTGGFPVLPRVKLRIEQTDRSTNCEIGELRLLATRKGRYTRNGIL